MPSQRSPTSVLLQQIVVRTGATPLRRAWRRLYRLYARIVVIGLTSHLPRASAYFRLPELDFVPGLSDIDLLIVLGGSPRVQEAAAERLHRRATRLRASRLGRLLPLIDDPLVFGEKEVRDLVGSNAMTYGLRQPGAFRSPVAPGTGEAASLSRVRILMRPGLYHTLEDWHPLSRSGAPLHDPPRDGQQQRIAAWLDLGFWWEVLPRACLRATGSRPADVCVKGVAESLKAWLWLARGEQVASRLQALQRGLELFPEEEMALREILELRQSLHRWKDTGSPLDRTLPLLVRLAQRIAELIDGQALAAGFTEVKLRGGDPTGPIVASDGVRPSVVGTRSSEIYPLLDWRGLVSPLLPDDTFTPLALGADDASAYLDAARLNHGPYQTFLADGLLIRPGAEYMRTRLRGIECRTTDPVSFALLEQKLSASFPNLEGWCAIDVARRAVAEHQAWLDPRTAPPASVGRRLGMLLSAARAAVFLASFEREPELPLTLADGVRALAETSLSTALLAEEGLEQYVAFAQENAEPSVSMVDDLRARLRELPAYGGGSHRQPAAQD